MDVPGWRREGPAERAASEASIDLYWLPLGAGGWFVRLNGRIYEAIYALLDARQALDLYHSALEVCLPEGRFVIEVSWPIQDAEGASRGVVLEGPVGSRSLARFRVSRYELRRWRDGVIPDADEAVASPQRLTDGPDLARGLLDLVGSVPRLVWGRDETGTGEMWNSNSVHLVADRAERSPNRRDRTSGGRTRTGVGRRARRGPPSGCRFRLLFTRYSTEPGVVVCRARYAAASARRATSSFERIEET